MSATIIDSLGNLVCYTNGVFLYDRNNVRMRYDTLNPGYYARGQYPSICYNFPQTALILAKPNNPNEYYLFHERIADPSNFNGYFGEGFYYTVVDARLRNGLGGVRSWRNLIVRDTLEVCKINAVRHANGRDWWITAWHIGLDKYRLCLLDPTGVHDLGWKVISNVRWASGFGQSFFSPDGNIFARTSLDIPANKSRIDVFDFDRCTGMLTNREQFYSPFAATTIKGLSISPNSRYLYLSSDYYILQYDLQAATIASTIDTVAVWDGFRDEVYPLIVTFWTHQLAPDGKIYISTGNGTHYMHTIDNPDISGVGCNVRQHSVRLPAFAFRTLPNFPNFRLGAVAGSVCDTLGYSATSPQKAQVLKVFPNPTSGILHIENLPPQARVVVYDALGREVADIPPSFGAGLLISN